MRGGRRTRRLRHRRGEGLGHRRFRGSGPRARSRIVGQGLRGGRQHHRRGQQAGRGCGRCCGHRHGRSGRAPRGQVGGHGGHRGFVQRVEPQRGDGDHRPQRGDEAHHHHDAVDGAGTLCHVGLVAVVGQQPAGAGAADGPAELLRKRGGREDQPGGAAAVFPLRVVGGVGIHRPHQRRGRRGAQADQRMCGPNHRQVVGRHEVKARGQHRRQRHRRHVEIALAEALGQGRGGHHAQDEGHRAGGHHRAEPVLATRHDVFEVIDADRAADVGVGERGDAHHAKHHPGLVGEQVLDVGLQRGFLAGLGLHPLGGHGEGEEVQRHRHGRVNDHRHLPALGRIGITAAKVLNHRYGGVDDDEHRQQRHHEAVGTGAGALLGAGRQHPQQGRVGDVDRRVRHHHQAQRDVGVHHPRAAVVGGHGEGGHRRQRHRHRHPHQVGPKVTPAGVRAVGQGADDRVDEGIAQPGDQQHRAHRGRAQQEHVGVVLGDEDREHLPEQVRRQIAKTVADLLGDGERWGAGLAHAGSSCLLRFFCHGSWPLPRAGASA